MSEQSILSEVVKHLRDALPYDVQESLSYGQRLTGLYSDARLEIQTRGSRLLVDVEIKEIIQPTHIAQLNGRLQGTSDESDEARLLICRYISINGRKLLKDQGINYADTAGNIYLQTKALYVYIETGDSDRSSIDRSSGRAFTKSGLKVLYQYFRSEKRLSPGGQPKDHRVPSVNDPVRNLAEQAEVSKDTVSKVIWNLLELGYIIKRRDKEYKWVQDRREELFTTWVTRCNQVLRPSLAHRTYRLLNDQPSAYDLNSAYQLGGYHAADRWLTLSADLRIDRPPFVVYTHRGFSTVHTDFKAVPDDNGDLIVFEAFWMSDRDVSANVDFPTIYADLLWLDHPRYMPVAEQIYQTYILKHLAR